MVFSNGKIVEEGSHQELIVKKGLYYNMVTSQEEPSNNEDGINNSSTLETSTEFQNTYLDPEESLVQIVKVNPKLIKCCSRQTTNYLGMIFLLIINYRLLS